MYIANSTGGLILKAMLYLANQTQMNSILDFPPPPQSDEGRCYGVYGCFPLNGPFTSAQRQINVHPQDPAEIEPRFPIFNVHNIDHPNLCDLNEPDRIRDFGINPDAKFFIISHGYLEAGDRPWIKEMVKRLLTADIDASVMVVDWGGGSSPPYVQAVANVRLVGAITAHVIHMIYEELRMKNLQNVHMIGHSLGAHLSGYTGFVLQRDFQLKLGRISGLDPAEPLFAETDVLVRLDKSDAHYVDVIHTDANPFMAGGLGMVKPIGHVDFYPNGGFDNPGCGGSFEQYIKDQDKSLFWSIQQFLGCNHIRSYQYFTESILPKCSFNAITCDSFESFKAGNCSECGVNNHHCLRFGYHSQGKYQALLDSREIDTETPIVAYLLTASVKPFCRSHYKMTVKVSDSEQSSVHGGEIGKLSVKLHSQRKKATDKMPFSPASMYFEPGHEYTSVVPGRLITEPIYATISWDYQTNLLNPLTWRILSAPRLYLDHIIVETIESDVKLKFCPLPDAPIIADSQNVLAIENC